MYKDTSQLKIEDFVFPYGNLDPENDWVKLAGLVPWETAEERYAAQFADNGAPNGGTLVLDATCCPAGIAYPQDVNLLNQKREKLEKTVDEICESTGEKKPRMYRQLAGRDFLRLSKSKKAQRQVDSFRYQKAAAIHPAGYRLHRPVHTKQRKTDRKAEKPHESGDYGLRNSSASCSRAEPTAFPGGSSVWPSLGCAPSSGESPTPILNLEPSCTSAWWMGMPGSNDWTLEPYNESEDFWSAVYRYHDCYGRWPERILADKLYRNRQTLSFCKEHGIRLSGPPLGKPPRDQDLSCQLKKHEYQDSCDRNEGEGVFGTGKTACGLGLV